MVERRPGPNGGKAAVVWEETGRCTTRATGVEVQARRERYAEITSGRSFSQPGLTATGPDPLCKGNRRQGEGGGLTHEPVPSNAGGVTPADVVRRDHDERDNTSIMQRGSGHLVASYVGQHLSFALYGKATVGRPRSEPAWGNPTVRDRRGACGNVDHGGTSGRLSLGKRHAQTRRRPQAILHQPPPIFLWYRLACPHLEGCIVPHAGDLRLPRHMRSGARQEFQHMAVGIPKVDASPTTTGVDLPVL